MNINTICVILAGGLARRMGNIDKAFVSVGQKPLLDHVLQRLSTQTSDLIINANGDASRFSKYNLPVIADTIPDHPGPLAGVLAALEWSRENRPDTNWVVSVPVDTPFVPTDLIGRFHDTIKTRKAQLTCAITNGRSHPVAGLWPVSLADDLRHAMTEEGLRKVDTWTSRFNLVHTEFDTHPIDPFFNINRPEDIHKAEDVLTGEE